MKRSSSSPTTLADRIDTLDDDFQLFAGPPATKPQLAAVAKALGIPLRKDHAALIAERSCFAVLVNEKVWPRPVEFDIRPAWQFCFGLEVFGIAPDTAPALDVVTQTNARQPAGKKRLVAAMKRIGDRRCVGYDRAGTLYEWEPGGDPERTQGGTLEEILLTWLETLATDREAMKAAPKKAKPKPKPKAAARRR